MSLTDHQFAAVVAMVGAAPGPAWATGRRDDRRRAARFAANVTLELAPCGRATADEVAAPAACTVRCLSATGVAVLCDRVFTTGERFLLHLPRAGGGPPVRIHCTVANTRFMAGGRFRVGARFTPPPGGHSPLLDPLSHGLAARLRRWLCA
jgi:hypothetical protein